MLIMVVIFVGILAFAFRSSEAKIEAYKLDSFQKQVLELVAGKISAATGESKADILAAYPESFSAYVQELKLEGFERKAFKAQVGDSTVAYCFEIGGKGLWGTMGALVSTSTDFREIVDFAIVDQMETPGLGARIEEDWFLEQFRNRIFVINPDSEDVTVAYEFVAESQVPENERQLKRVTGATITSDSVVKMLRAEFNYIYRFMRDQQL